MKEMRNTERLSAQEPPRILLSIIIGKYKILNLVAVFLILKDISTVGIGERGECDLT